MTHDKFKRLVRCGEELFTRDPQAYRRRLGLLLLSGKALYGMLLLLPLALIPLLIWLCAAAGKTSGCLWMVIALLVFEAVLVKGLFRKHVPPAGLPLDKASLPKLFEEVESVRRKVNAPCPDKVILDGSLNAAVAQLPGRGFLSAGESILVLGLPLMAALSPEQFRSVLAHEFGHLSLDHPGHFRKAWLARDVWAKLKEEIDSGGGVFQRILIGPFINWYIPRLDAMLSVLSRMNEFDADAQAARVAGKEAAASALALSRISDRRLGEQAFKPFWERARKAPEPEPGVNMTGVRTLRQSRPTEEELRAEIEAQRGRKALESDSHPSLGERLAKLGVESVSVPSGPDAAELLLGAETEPLAAGLDMIWVEEARATWRRIHEEAAFAKRALAEMLSAPTGEPSLEMKLKRAQLLEMASGEDAAFEPLARIVEEHPGCALAKLHLGRVMLSKRKPGGPELIKEAMSLDRRLLTDGSTLLAGYYEAEGMEHERDETIERWEKGLNGFVKDAKEAMSLKLRHIYAGHGLTPPEMDKLIASLAGDGRVAKAYLVRKSLKKDDESPVHVLLVSRKFSLAAFRGEDDSALASELAAKITVLGPFHVCPFDRCPILIQWRIRRIKGSLIFKS